MPSFDMDYCPVCDQGHNKRDSLFCSPKCKKLDAKRHSSALGSPPKSPTIGKSRSNLPVYALSNTSTSSVTSDSRPQRRSIDQDSQHPTRPSASSTTSSQRPLPPIKRNSYSSSLSRSVELVTPLTPLTSNCMSRVVTRIHFNKMN